MTFNINIPQPNDDLSVSQGQVKNNFLTSNTSFGVNHYPFNDGTVNNGKHKRVDIVAGAVPASNGGEGNLYTKQPASYTNLFYTQDASSNEYQMTRIITTSFPKFATNTALSVGNGGWTFLPGGMLFQYGSATVNFNTSGNKQGTITFPVAFTNIPYAINVTLTSASGSSSAHVLSVFSVGVSSFKWNLDDTSSQYTGFYWTAIGV